MTIRRLAPALAAMAMVAHASAARADDEGRKKLDVGGALAFWIPQSDADDFADPSIGLRPGVTYWFFPFFGVTGHFDFVFVNEESGADDTDYYAFSVGGRFTLPGSLRIKPYGELLLGWHWLDAGAFDESEIGFQLGGGATYAINQRLQANLGIGYSTTNMDAPFVDITVAAFIIDVGIAARF